MDEGRIVICHGVPQGWMRYVPVGGRMELRAGKPEAPDEVGCRPPAGGRASAAHC
jgi:hypothetical protein